MSENSETQTDWEVEDKIRFLLENLIVDIGVQVTDDYKDKNGLYEGMSIKNVRSRNKYIKLFVELLADARREGHPTINGFCCACDYDIEFMKHDREFEIESLKKTCKHCGVIRGVKLHEDTDSHDRYQVGYNKAIDDVLATLKEETL